MAKLNIEYAIAKLAGNPLVERIDDEGANGFTVWAKEGSGWKVGDSIRPATQFLPGTSAKHFHLEVERLVRVYPVAIEATVETLPEPAAEIVIEELSADEQAEYQDDCAGDAEHERRAEEGE